MRHAGIEVDALVSRDGQTVVEFETVVLTNRPSPCSSKTPETPEQRVSFVCEDVSARPP